MPKKPSNKTLENKAMALWGELAHAMYDRCYAWMTGECSGPLQAHHLISRSRATTRHDPKNICMACSKHHTFSSALSPHKAPLQFAEFLREPDWPRAKLLD